MRRFLLRRLLGLAMVAQGALQLVGLGRLPQWLGMDHSLNLWIARKIARENGRMLMRKVSIEEALETYRREGRPETVTAWPYPDAERDIEDAHGNPL